MAIIVINLHHLRIESKVSQLLIQFHRPPAIAEEQESIKYMAIPSTRTTRSKKNY